MRWPLAFLALLLPPLALFGKGALSARSAGPLLWAIALGIFFTTAWSVGAALAGLAGVLAARHILRHPPARHR